MKFASRLKRRRHALLFWMFVLLAAPVAAQAREPAQCTVENARAMSIGEASERRRRLEQACVRVTGILDGATLYGNLDDVYRGTAIWRHHDRELRYVDRIGLRPFPEGLEVARSDSSAARQVTLVGRLHDCDRDWGQGVEDGEVVIRMGTGWCHYHNGAVLTPIAVVSEAPISVERRMGRRAWREVGDIAPLAIDSEMGVEVLAFFDRVREAARRNDRRELLNLHSYSRIAMTADEMSVASDEVDEGVGAEAQHAIDLWFGEADSILSIARVSGERPNVQLFAPRWETGDYPEVWACWGRTSLSEQNWPISSMDTGVVAGRPYACISMVKERRDSSGPSPHEVWVARTWGGPTPLAEPRR